MRTHSAVREFSGKERGHSIPEYRLARCAVEWRVRLGEARRAGRALVAGRPCIDPLDRGGECREHCDDHRNGEKYDSSTVAVRLVTHEGASSNLKTSGGLDGSRGRAGVAGEAGQKIAKVSADVVIGSRPLADPDSASRALNKSSRQCAPDALQFVPRLADN
jgi:hypothetical protein